MKIFFVFKFTVWLLIILTSCINKENSENNGICIDIGGQIDVFEESLLSTYSNDISYIPLSNENGSLIKYIHSIDFYEDKILISDMKSCFLFNKQGEFISKIGSIGNGPKEYKFVDACKIANNKYIYIQDHNYIKCYNHEGNFISKHNLPVQNNDEGVTRSWQLINDTTFIVKIPNYTGKSPYCARVFSLSGKTLKERRNFSFFNRKENYVTDTDGKASIYYYGNNWYFKEMLNDTIFYVSPDFNFSPAYVINLGKYRMKDAYNELGFLERMKTFNDYVFIDEVFETDKNLFFNISMGKHFPYFILEKVHMIDIGIKDKLLVLGIYSKENNNFTIVKPTMSQESLILTGIQNNIDNGPDFHPKAKINDTTLLSWIDSYRLKAYVLTNKFKNSIPQCPEKKKQLIEMANNLDENDNPILIIVKLKE